MVQNRCYCTGMKTRKDELEEWGTEIIFGQARGFRAWVMRCLLRMVSWVFFLIVKIRLFLFRSHIKRVSYLATQVISVGNITAGGTGKTPVVEFLSRTLSERGRKCAILTRGYKSEDLDEPQYWTNKKGKVLSKNLPKIASDGKQCYLSPLKAGDEPYMLARNLPDVAVLVDKDRIKSGLFALNELGTDTLILDDGMQYLKLRHEIDIVLVDCGAPFGTGSLLPRGTLREPRTSLKRASYIILTKSGGKPQDELITTIRKYNKVADIIVTDHSPVLLENIYTGEQKPLEYLQGKHVACLSGIARPESFENLASQLGAKVDIKRRYPDHYWFSQHDLNQFEDRCVARSMDFILTTEKDAVRFLYLDHIEVPVYFLRIHIEIFKGQEHWDKMIDRICKLTATQPTPEWGTML